MCIPTMERIKIEFVDTVICACSRVINHCILLILDNYDSCHI